MRRSTPWLEVVRLDLLLIRHHPGLSRRRARDVIEKGQVSVDGERVREAGREVEDTATVVFDPNRRALPRARCTLPVLYQDEHVMVVDKPAGMLSVPSAPGLREEDSALHRVQDYARRLKPHGWFAERVHRLDRDTSGALAFALSPEARAGLLQTFRDHRIERVYLAVVSAEPRQEHGVVDAPVREEWSGGRRGVARADEPSRPALTRWRVRERLAGFALLEVTLETGRQHQIRAHLAHVGTPVMGDLVYGRARPVPERTAPRPLLHAWRLGFAHPVTGERVAVESPVPDDLARVLARLRRQAAGEPRPR
ncbi:MAG TPA: RluA family pseudouridine synthase [Vicinamibacteria bacterium]|nr:RluA family pseudouridine synthase [Vicinamibacteria bacterium]